MHIMSTPADEPIVAVATPPPWYAVQYGGRHPVDWYQRAAMTTPALLRLRLPMVVAAAVLVGAPGPGCDDDPETSPDTGAVDAADDSGDPARIQIIHDIDDAAADRFDLYFDDDRIVGDFAHRTSTPLLDVDPGDHTVSLAESGSQRPDDSVATFQEVDLEPDERYVMVVSGLLEPDDVDETVDGSEIALYLFEGALGSAPDETADELLLFHGAPDVAALDVVIDDTMAVVTDLDYGAFTDGYLSVPPGVSQFDIREATSDRLVGAYQTPDLAGGDARIGLVSGMADPAGPDDASLQLLLYPAGVDDETVEPIAVDETDDRTTIPQSDQDESDRD